jgi:hypothetical protein
VVVVVVVVVVVLWEGYQEGKTDSRKDKGRKIAGKTDSKIPGQQDTRIARYTRGRKTAAGNKLEGNKGRNKGRNKEGRRIADRRKERGRKEERGGKTDENRMDQEKENGNTKKEIGSTIQERKLAYANSYPYILLLYYNIIIYIL